MVKKSHLVCLKVLSCPSLFQHFSICNDDLFLFNEITFCDCVDDNAIPSSNKNANIAMSKLRFCDSIRMV